MTLSYIHNASDFRKRLSACVTTLCNNQQPMQQPVNLGVTPMTGVTGGVKWRRRVLTAIHGVPRSPCGMR